MSGGGCIELREREQGERKSHVGSKVRYDLLEEQGVAFFLKEGGREKQGGAS